jgi:CRISP-associated protein Cas1
MIYVVDFENAEIDVDGGRLLVRADGQRRATLPIKQMERLITVSSSEITSRCLAALALEGVGLLSLGGRFGRDPVHILPNHGDASKRLAQARMVDHECARTSYGRKLLGAKLSASLETLKSVEQNQTVRQASAQIIAALQRIQTSNHAIETLRGIEGAAAAAFFEAYQTLFLSRLGFNARNRRPPTDPVNACLSLGYTLAYHEALLACAKHGLDAYMPGLHDMAAGRAALACDVMEPARAVIEHWVWQRFKTGEQGIDDFSKEGGACLLRKPARDGFYRSWAQDTKPKAQAAIEVALGHYLTALGSFRGKPKP